MPFSPEEIEKKEFLLTLRGYDKEEVRAFLEAVSSDYATLYKDAQSRDEIPDNAYEMIGREVGTVIQTAKESAMQMKRKAEEDAAELRMRADQEAARIRDAATNASSRLREEAEQYSVEVRAKADQDVANRVRESQRRLERLQSTEAKVRQRLYSLEAMIQNLRQELENNDAAGVDVVQLDEKSAGDEDGDDEESTGDAQSREVAQA